MPDVSLVNDEPAPEAMHQHITDTDTHLTRHIEQKAVLQCCEL